MPVKIHGKDYLTVAERIATFRSDHKDWTINTELVSNGDMVVIKATILDSADHQVGSGYAEELRGSTNINKTSALENCETSAIGRALASCGYGGEQYASANEVGDAIVNQAKMEVADWFKAHNAKVAENIDSICVIKEHINSGDMSTAAEAWYELPEEDQRILWVAPSKGGMFTTIQREIIKSTEFKEAYYGTGESNETGN